MNQLIETMFRNRQYTDSFLKEIENYHHDVLQSSDDLCRRLLDIRDNHRLIVIIPDFDMDGVMSGVCGFAGLAELGFNVALFIPDPNDGYGFTKATIKRLLAEYPLTEAIITCDVGVTCYEGIDFAKSVGIEVLVTDHHIQEKQINADVLVNPKKIGETYAHPGICGAYVLYQVLQQFADTYCDKFMSEQISRLRVFAGIGTVSDMMPVLYENRQLIRDAIDICKLIYLDRNDFIVNSIPGCDIYRRAFYGLFVTLCAFNDAGKIRDSESIDEQFFGYYLAPTFNSVKRMGKSMTEPFGVFFDSNPETKVNNLISWNEERKALEVMYMNEILTRDQPYAPEIYLTTAPSGILGLLAQKLMLAHNKEHPVLVLNESDTKYHGSGRSPEWYPFFTRTHDNFYVAGHDVAFGIGFTDKRELEAYHAFIKKDVADVYANVDIVEAIPDAVIATDGSGDFTIDLWTFAGYLREINDYKPFGNAFPAPQFLLKFNASEGEWSVMGSVKQHLKIKLAYGFEVLLWNQAQYASWADSDAEIQVLGNIQSSEFNGNITFNFVGTVVDNA